MVSHQLVYVTGMLEVILAPSDPSGGSKRVAEVCIDLRATASNQNHASERSLYPYGDLSDAWF